MADSPHATYILSPLTFSLSNSFPFTSLSFDDRAAPYSLASSVDVVDVTVGVAVVVDVADVTVDVEDVVE